MRELRVFLTPPHSNRVKCVLALASFINPSLKADGTKCFFKAVTLPIDNQYVIPFNNSFCSPRLLHKKKVTHTVRKSTNCVQIFNFHFSGKNYKIDNLNLRAKYE